MATKTPKPAAPLSAKTAPAPASTAIVRWEDELAKHAQAAAAVEESTATGQFFSLKSGILAFNDAPLPNNQMAAIILDGILENIYYEGAYDPDTPQGPKCFAFGRADADMAPHKVVFEAGNNMSDRCGGCEMNEWGSAEKGRGKACRNTRRLALIPGGTFEDDRFRPFTDPGQLEAAPLAYMKIPVTSVKGYAGFVKQVSAALHRPPFAVFTKIAVRPDPVSQFKVSFEAISQVPDELLAAVLARHAEARTLIDFPYTPFEEVEALAPKRGGKAAPPARAGKAAKRY